MFIAYKTYRVDSSSISAWVSLMGDEEPITLTQGTELEFDTVCSSSMYKFKLHQPLTANQETYYHVYLTYNTAYSSLEES